MARNPSPQGVRGSAASRRRSVPHRARCGRTRRPRPRGRRSRSSSTPRARAARRSAIACAAVSARGSTRRSSDCICTLNPRYACLNPRPRPLVLVLERCSIFGRRRSTCSFSLGTRCTRSASPSLSLCDLGALLDPHVVQYRASTLPSLTPSRTPSATALRYASRAKEQTCMCKQCTNFKNYQEVLHSLVKVLA